MRGSIKWQVKTVFSTVNNIGESKHEAKELARENGATTWHSIGKNLGVHSYKTLDDYRAIARQCLEYAKENFNIKDIEKLSSEHISSFLQEKIDAGLSKTSLQKYCAALEKLEVALNKYAETKQTGRQYNFSDSLREVRQEIKNINSNNNSRYRERIYSL